MNRDCKRCVGFKTRQGTGSFGECRINPPTRKGFPGVNESDGCFNGFVLNRAKYDITGRKIYTRKNNRMITSEDTVRWEIGRLQV